MAARTRTTRNRVASAIEDTNGTHTEIPEVPEVKVSAKTAEPKRIELPKLQIRSAKITIVGDSPLISHRWSEKAKKAMLDKQMKRAKPGKAAKNPIQDFLDSMYWMDESKRVMAENDDEMPDLEGHKFGFPAIAFKAAAVDACSHIDGVTKVEARGAFHIDAELVEIEGTPSMREDMVRIAMGTADIRYRGEFKTWKATFVVRYNENVLSLEQIVNIVNTAGFAVGIGEWRPQKDGSYGMFHVATAEDLAR